MKTIQCAHPPHHHNGFVATYLLWTASGGVHALLEPTEGSTSTWLGGWVHWIVFVTSLYICIMLFALCLLSTLCVMNQFLF